VRNILVFISSPFSSFILRQDRTVLLKLVLNLWAQAILPSAETTDMHRCALLLFLFSFLPSLLRPSRAGESKEGRGVIRAVISKL
jgi:hypothetical protein